MYHEGFMLEYEISASYLGFLISYGFLHANFDDHKGRTRLLPKKKSCSIMSLVFPLNFSSIGAIKREIWGFWYKLVSFGESGLHELFHVDRKLF